MKQTIEVVTQWGKLFGLKYSHEYYHDGYGTDFTYFPSEETRQVMRNLRLALRAHNGGIMVLYDGQAVHRLFEKNTKLPEKLTFYIKNNAKYFTNFSDLSFESNGRLYYFSNDTNKAGKQNFIHAGERLTEEAEIQTYTRFQNLYLAFPKAKAFSDIKIINAAGEEIPLEPALKKVDVSEKLTEHRISLRNLSEGKYTAKVKGEKTDFSFYLRDTSSEQIWGIIDIFLKPTGKSGQIFSAKELLKPNYTLHIGARDTYWKYILVGQNGKDKNAYSDAKVIYNSEEIDFTKPVKMTLGNGKTAYSIESKKPIKLKEVRSQTDRLQLKLKAGGKWIPRAVKLPKPDISMLKPDTKANKIYSTTYIYV